MPGFSTPLHAKCTAPFRHTEEKRKDIARQVASPRAVHNQQHEFFTEEHDASRRELLALVACAAALHASKADADQPSALKSKYYGATDRVQSAVKDVLAVNIKDPSYKQKLDVFRYESNRWVSDYRRVMGMSKKSFAETYGVINALQGHYTMFGDKKALPDKLLGSVNAKLEAAQKSLQREKSRDPSFIPNTA